MINSEETISRIIEECHTIAVVGLSSDTWRPSNSVSNYMRRSGYRVIPVNPNETEVFGEKAYADLASVPEKIDLVDVFRRSEEAEPPWALVSANVMPAAEQDIRKWFQP